MNLTFLGTGYVGLVTGTCLAELGHSVTCVDINPERIATLNAGKVPIYEPGLEDLVAKNRGRMKFSTDFSAGADVIFIAVGTPQDDSGAADLRFVEAAFDQIAAAKFTGIVVIRSTVPPGTGDRMQQRLAAAGCGAAVVNAPEFLAEGTAVKDFMQPNRIVAGGPADATALVLALFDGLPDAPRIATDRPTAELIKYASNTFLAARVSLINEMANLCDAVGANVEVLASAVGMDDRIGSKFLRAGIGYGGSCFPKDVQAMAAVARAAGVAVPVAEAVEVTNQAQWLRVISALTSELGNLAGKKIGVWGIAFKPGTDDVREAPGIKIMRELVASGAIVSAFDPVAKLPTECGAQSAGALAAIDGADALVHVTEWPDFQEIDPATVAAKMQGKLVIDGRNTLDKTKYRAAGLRIMTIGAQ